eukprot:2097189-Amphidinium_carterae.1
MDPLVIAANRLSEPDAPLVLWALEPRIRQWPQDAGNQCTDRVVCFPHLGPWRAQAEARQTPKQAKTLLDKSGNESSMLMLLPTKSSAGSGSFQMRCQSLTLLCTSCVTVCAIAVPPKKNDIAGD